MDKLLTKSFVESTNIDMTASEALFDQLSVFQELMVKYNSAIREVKTKLEILNDELSVNSSRNPIESIKSRIKKPKSILHKLQKKNLELSLESIINSVYDVAGIRVICSFIDDIYKVVGMLTRQDDIRIIEIKDYIKQPKENGYRSYHVIVEIPVFFSNEKQFVKVEIQFRTIAMDFWASLEHQLHYKNETFDSESISKELRQCSLDISVLDYKMMKIRNRIFEIGTDEI